jgi:class 3 adenylate cyclase
LYSQLTIAWCKPENLGSDAAAARACLESARALRAAAVDVAVRSDVEPGDLVLRFGLHWGSTLYVGAITTEGRFEVTAMGDEVNEAARIEACATGGLTLASKDLIERLTPDDALELGLNASRMKYIPLAELASATEKARRDAPSLAVCAI